MTLPVVLALLVAFVVLLPGSWPGTGIGRLAPTRPARVRSRWLGMLLLTGVLGTVLGLVPGLLVWLLCLLVVAATVGWIIRGQVRGSRVEARSREAERAAGTLALLLASGYIPDQALVEAAQDCPCLAPAAAAVRLGGDVVGALSRAGDVEGSDGLGMLAAAWTVSQASGAPVADVIARVAESLREERRIGGVVAVELSAARVSGRVMALLPFAAIGLGTMVGANPVPFLFNDPTGRWLMLAGLSLAGLGVVWTERISAGARSSRGERRRTRP